MVHEGDPKATDQFTFIQVDQSRGGAGSASLRDVRRHAVRIALQQKKLGKKFVSPVQHPPFSHGAGRFRLATETSNARKSKSTVSTTTVASTEASIPEDVNDIPKKEETTWSISFTRAGSSGLLDPFDPLPFKLGLRQQKLLYYYKLHLLAREF
jgi:hypothetical protein